MTPVLLVGPAVLSLVVLASSRVREPARLRVIRGASAIGILLALAVVVGRAETDAWRATHLEAGPAAVAGVACACAWGLSLALDLGGARWWPAALTGVGATGLLLFTAATWTVPALLFWVTMSCALGIAAARGPRLTWIALALGDAGLAGALWLSHVLENGGWLLPDALGGVAVVPAAIALVARVGVVPGLGPFGSFRTPGAALVPLWVGGGFVVTLRLIERPAPAAGAAALVLALAIAGWSIVRRSLHPGVLAVWPVALGLGLCLLSERAGAAAAVAAVLGVTVVALWPDSIGRGRLARGFLLSCALPNVIFGAVATVASESFVQATRGPTSVIESGAWLAAAALLPVALGAGVALGAVAARSGAGADYHPEAVFMTWLTLGASVLAGIVLGAGGVYAVLGGERVVFAFAIALVAGAVAARGRVGGEPALGLGAPSADVTLTEPPSLPIYAGIVALLLQVVGAGVVVWLTVGGLRVGFL